MLKARFSIAWSLDGALITVLKTRKLDNDEIWIACATCNRETCHRVVAATERVSNGPGGHRIRQEYMIVECQGCKELSFCRCRNFEPHGNVKAKFLKDLRRHGRLEIYPKRIAGRPQLDGIEELPLGLL